MRVSRDKVNAEAEAPVGYYTKDQLFGSYDFITPLQQNGFFPEASKESVWAISYEGEALGIYKQKEQTWSYSSYLLDQIDVEADGTLYFTYFPSGEERAKHLFERCKGNKQELYLAGDLDEYQEYSISDELEQRWRTALIEANRYQPIDETANINEAVAFFKQVMVRPGMYVGKNRLDLVQIYLDGWCAHQKPLWNLSYDLKRWLFLTESAVGSGSLGAWNPLYEMYGTTDLAIEKFREFLAINVPTSLFTHGRWDTVTDHMAPIWADALHPEGPIKTLLPYLDFHYDEEMTVEAMHTEIIRQVERIIGEPSERIKIFIHTGRAVQQLRFFFDKGQGWEDGLSLKDLPDYYEKLVVLHGYIKRMEMRNPGACITTLDWQEQKLQVCCEAYQAPAFHFFHEQSPEKAFLLSHQFATWKQREIDRDN